MPDEVTPTVNDERIQTLETLVKEQGEKIAGLTQEKTTLAEKVALAERDREMAHAYAQAQEAQRFVEARSVKDNFRLFPTQREYAVRLFQTLDATGELITAEEGVELKLFTEGEKPKAMSARECLVRLVDSYPNRKDLAEEQAQHREARPETFDEAFARVIEREKLDPKDYAARSKVARIVLTENPNLVPSYGSERVQ